MSTRKTTSKAIYIFVSASILAILALAYLFRPPFDSHRRARRSPESQTR
jgi:hypothetical protein